MSSSSNAKRNDSHAIKSTLNHVEKLIAVEKHSSWYFQQHRKRFEITLGEITKVIDNLRKESNRPYRLVDIGSHELHILLALRLLYPDLELTGVDISCFTDAPQIIKLAKEHRISLTEFESLESGIPLPDDLFDLVLFFDTLEHLNFYPLPVFRRLFRIISPQGFLVVTTPNQLTIGMLKHFILRKSIHQDIRAPYTIGTHYRCYTMDEVCYLMEKAGLEVMRRAYLEFSPMYLGFFQRRLHGLITNLIKAWANNMIVVGRKS